MKKTILISAGILAIFLIIAVWVYLFLYGAPEDSREIFGRFNMGDGDAEFAPQEESDEEEFSVENERGKALQQLTTRPVAGAVFTHGTIRYVERGTGYVYEITPEGKETQITNTTIPQTVVATFSPDGTRVVMTAQRNEKNETLIARIEELGDEPGSLEGVSLPDGVTNIDWQEEGKGVYYLDQTAIGSAGYFYDLDLAVSKKLFEIPLRDVRVLWREDARYVFTIPTARQVGYVYRLNGNSLEYVTNGEKGLMAIPYEEGMVITRSENGTLRSSNLNDSTPLPFPLLPDKCTPAFPSFDSVLYCAASLALDPGEYPDDWYKGARTFIDSLWEVDLATGESTLLSHMLSESGREIDVSSIGSDPTGDYIYFVNKNDGTLWLLDTTKII